MASLDVQNTSLDVRCMVCKKRIGQAHDTSFFNIVEILPFEHCTLCDGYKCVDCLSDAGCETCRQLMKNRLMVDSLWSIKDIEQKKMCVFV